MTSIFIAGKAWDWIATHDLSRPCYNGTSINASRHVKLGRVPCDAGEETSFTLMSWRNWVSFQVISWIWNLKFTKLISQNCLFECIKNLQCFESTRRCSHLPLHAGFTIAADLNYFCFRNTVKVTEHSRTQNEKKRKLSLGVLLQRKPKRIPDNSRTDHSLPKQATLNWNLSQI